MIVPTLVCSFLPTLKYMQMHARKLARSNQSYFSHSNITRNVSKNLQSYSLAGSKRNQQGEGKTDKRMGARKGKLSSLIIYLRKAFFC